MRPGILGASQTGVTQVQATAAAGAAAIKSRSEMALPITGTQSTFCGAVRMGLRVIPDEGGMHHTARPSEDHTVAKLPDKATYGFGRPERQVGRG